MRQVKAFGDRVLGVMLEKPGGHRTLGSGLLVPDQDAETSGIRPRWFKIHSIGEKVNSVSEGQYVLVAHGRWSNGIKVDEELEVWLLDNDELLGVSDTNPMEEN